MRTTVNLDEDVVAAIEQLRRERSIGLSAALNELARAGLTRGPQGAGEPFRQRTAALGMLVDVTDIGGVLGMLDQEAARDR